MFNEVDGYQDETEAYRRQRQAQLNASQPTRELLEAQYGQVWDTTQLQQDFAVTGFAAPYVVVMRLSDKKRGSLEFSHSPRFYYHFVVDEGK